jgi:hypothetical protein
VIALRHRVFTVMAVFFALAIGIVLGSGPLRGESHRSLSERGGGEISTDLRSQITGLRSSNAFNDDFARTAAPGLIAGRLRGRTVTVLALPTASRADVSALEGLVGTAGGSVTGTLQVGEKLVDAGNKQLVDQLGSQLAVRAKHARVPAGATTYDRIGALIARAVATRTPGGRPVDGTATAILSGLGTAHLLSAQGRLNRQGDLVLFVAGRRHGDSVLQKGAGAIVTALVSAVDARSAGVVLAGPLAAAQGDGEVAAVRSDVDATKDVSTVDSVDRVDGQVVTILALAQQAAGRVGQYGAVHAASGAMPGAS